MQVPDNLTGRRESLARKTKHAADELQDYSKSARDLRRKMSQFPPDELSKTDLLAMRAGMIKNLETHAAVADSLVKLLNTIADSIHNGSNRDP